MRQNRMQPNRAAQRNLLACPSLRLRIDEAARQLVNPSAARPEIETNILRARASGRITWSRAEMPRRPRRLYCRVRARILCDVKRIRAHRRLRDGRALYSSSPAAFRSRRFLFVPRLSGDTLLRHRDVAKHDMWLACWMIFAGTTRMLDSAGPWIFRL